jgi:hypothetical protein
MDGRGHVVRNNLLANPRLWFHCGTSSKLLSPLSSRVACVLINWERVKSGKNGKPFCPNELVIRCPDF